jgi:hypothetical protein
MAFVLVDAENVRRSLWPNMSREQLLERAQAWAEREGHEVRVVFEGARSADDVIADLAGELEQPFWVVTSDRGLRARLGDRPDRIVGGGTFARTI